MDPTLNLALKNLCENMTCASVKSEDICSLHQEELKLFCLNHQQLVCLICRDAKIHAGHKFCPRNEALQDLKVKLQDGLQKAKEIFKDYHDCRETCNEQAEYINVQREKVERKIKILRSFVASLTLRRMPGWLQSGRKRRRNVRSLRRGLRLSRSTEEQLASCDVSFLKNVQTAMNKIQELPKEPELLPGGLLDEAKHVGNLKFNVWEGMKEMLSYSPVILDPNTAHPVFSLSEDLTSLVKEAQQRPKNPERNMRHFVLGSALESGRHIWDVEVGGNNDWQVGVAWGDPCFPGKILTWCIGIRDCKYTKPSVAYGAWNPPVEVLRVRVDVDINEKSLSLSEPLTNTELFSVKNPSNWPDLSSNCKMYRYFYTTSTSPLKIIPFLPRVTTQMC
ncbi:nuclear factor 7, ovary-like [Corythoichthys intestinalis]|uniref:nuclear factor 7, ovary-like n=1 Tax=Corythoichthys intestinalis TaxID=161448 RepID=UPI0025A570D1|nr:nuclear factor 7, ovary-like [Corythoichthys intestinalis]